MKRLLLASLAVVCVGLSLAVAQTINRSVQLSLDAGGMFPVSTPGGLFVPDRIHGNSTRTPTVANQATGNAITGTDLAGEIIEGTGANSATILTFTRPQLATPYCVGVSNAVATPVAMTTVSPNGFVASHSSNTFTSGQQAAQLRIFYTCISARIQ